jgi:hypothetical protein
MFCWLLAAGCWLLVFAHNLHPMMMMMMMMMMQKKGERRDAEQASRPSY